MLRRAPLLTATAPLTIAIGAGATTATPGVVRRGGCASCHPNAAHAFIYNDTGQRRYR